MSKPIKVVVVVIVVVVFVKKNIGPILFGSKNNPKKFKPKCLIQKNIG